MRRENAVYKVGHPTSVPEPEAIEDAQALALAANEGLSPEVVSADVIRTDGHDEAGEYLVRVVVSRQPIPMEL